MPVSEKIMLFLKPPSWFDFEIFLMYQWLQILLLKIFGIMQYPHQPPDWSNNLLVVDWSKNSGQRSAKDHSGREASYFNAAGRCRQKVDVFTHRRWSSPNIDIEWLRFKCYVKYWRIPTMPTMRCHLPKMISRVKWFGLVNANMREHRNDSWMKICCDRFCAPVQFCPPLLANIWLTLSNLTQISSDH